ncbi:MAG: hypothetical protein AMK69_17625, partial [Nitrospira bacterium SG8_3]
RQSVRATFKLSEKAISAISIVSIHLGIKQKSLFDHLIEDTKSLNIIAQEAHSDRPKRGNRMQKTYVLSRKTLSTLDRISRIFDIPRDALVEHSIERLLPLIAREREKHRLRKEILNDLGQYLEHGKKILGKSKEYLGEDDPVTYKIESALVASIHAYDYTDSYIEKGRIIEDF